jgi:DNA-binding NarL/FixJ family response regulator
MIVDVYVPSQILEKRLVQLFKESEIIENAFFHKSIDLLMNSLMTVRRSITVIIDVDSEIHVDYFNKLNDHFNDIKCISISKIIEIQKLIQLHKIGFLAHIDLEYTSLDIIQALRKVSKGERFLSQSQTNDFINFVLNNDIDNISESSNGKVNLNIESKDFNVIKVQNYLTTKEKSVCEFLLKGYSYKEISDALGTSTFTVNQRVRSIYRKLEVRSRAELSYKYLV